MVAQNLFLRRDALKGSNNLTGVLSGKKNNQKELIDVEVSMAAKVELFNGDSVLTPLHNPSSNNI